MDDIHKLLGSVQAEWQPECIEVLNDINLNFVKNETHITMQIQCPKTFRLIQIPFDRIHFAGFVRTVAQAADGA